MSTSPPLFIGDVLLNRVDLLSSAIFLSFISIRIIYFTYFIVCIFIRFTEGHLYTEVYNYNRPCMSYEFLIKSHVRGGALRKRARDLISHRRLIWRVGLISGRLTITLHFRPSIWLQSVGQWTSRVAMDSPSP